MYQKRIAKAQNNSKKITLLIKKYEEKDW
jgi:hypothetical protein